MKIKKLIFIIYGVKDYIYKLFGYSLPLGMGGSENVCPYAVGKKISGRHEKFKSCKINGMAYPAAKHDFKILSA